MTEKKVPAKEKLQLHPRNKHRERYDFKQLIKSCPELAKFVSLNKFNDESIDFFNPEAVKTLNKALLKHFYKIDYWDIPENYLCPPIPGRVDYIHYLADLLQGNKKPIRCLDIGTGSNCIYPILGFTEYNWDFVATDIDAKAIKSAQNIIAKNPHLQEHIKLRIQEDSKKNFAGIIQENERFDLSICNPPFHSSAAAANEGSRKKLNKLQNKKITNVRLNFGGQHNELWCEGGEKAFLNKKILESKTFATSCTWFTSLVSKKETLEPLYKTLKKVNASSVKTISMAQGNKVSRILAWSFVVLEK
jgi:23S rRNA (adenine1618-N6)-methyltransferase